MIACMRLARFVFVGAAGLTYAQEVLHTASPRVVRTVPPEYTKEGLRAKVEGNVVLTAIVGVDGAISEIHVLRGLGSGLDEKAVECLRRWEFSPATNHGDPVSEKVTVEISFRLPMKKSK
jgi:protein TonB